MTNVRVAAVVSLPAIKMLSLYNETWIPAYEFEKFDGRFILENNGVLRIRSENLDSEQSNFSVPSVCLTRWSNNVSLSSISAAKPDICPSSFWLLILATASSTIGWINAFITFIGSFVLSLWISSTGQIILNRSRELTASCASRNALLKSRAKENAEAFGESKVLDETELGMTEPDTTVGATLWGYGRPAARLLTHEPNKNSVAESSVNRPIKSWYKNG